MSIQDMLMPKLLDLVRKGCERIQDSAKRAVTISLPDCLMSGIAMFGLKYPSLLQFDQDSHSDDTLQHNLKTLYGIENVPGDTYFRERLDLVDPYELQGVINKIINSLKINKAIEQYQYMDNYYLVSLDATGNFSSNKVHCEHCCVKNHKDGRITYHHQTLAAVMVHPGSGIVLPLAIEPITKKDGATKNDCEHSAAKRLLVTLRNSHPNLNMIIVLDALYADSSIISLLKELQFKFIINAKEKDLKYLFDEYKFSKKEELEIQQDKNCTLNFRFANFISLNYAHNEIKVNVLECTETKKGEATNFCWISDIKSDKDFAPIIALAGRTRWRIENETFNTLKNQGYQYEHNFGHGNKNLCSVLTFLMFIAFLVDQILQLCCTYFIKALTKCKSRVRLWRKMQGLFLDYFIDSWEQLYLLIINGLRGRASELLNSS